MLDPDNLRKIAQAATPGPWQTMGRFIETEEWVEGQDGDIVSPEVECMAYCYGGSARGIGNPADAAFIATFNPETVLALLDRVEKAERRVSRLKNREQKALGSLREAKAALQRVREQHRTYSYYELEDSCPDTSESHREERHHESDEIGEFYCEDMPTGVVVCEWCYDEDGERMDWPCPTIRALEGDE